MSIDIAKYKRIYFIGIKGVALSGLAVICMQKGKEVAGSDTDEEFITDSVLAEHGIKVFKGFNADNLNWQPDCVVVGASWEDTHIEVQEAKKRGIVTITDSELRGQLSKEKVTIAVTGTHGKTTTTALLSFVCNSMQLQPSYLIGTGAIKQLPAHAQWGDGKHFTIESDEYIKSQSDRQPKFLDLEPALSIITSLEYEHVDVYRNIEELEGYFEQLIDNTKQKAVVCGDWKSCQKIIQKYKDKVITYGVDRNNDYYIDQLEQSGGKTTFTVVSNGELFGEYSIQLWGKHNALNALACIVITEHLGLDRLEVRQALQKFSGLQRRTEMIVHDGITFIDDYGHHPTEIDVTLKAIKQHFPEKKICCIFQSHTFTRTQTLLADFVKSFASADEVIVVDIFPSARERVTNFTTDAFISALQEQHHNVVAGGSIKEATKFVESKLSADTVFVTMGAGDVYKIRDAIISK